jgi:hypothetical protein
MHFDLHPFLYLWIVLAAVVGVLFGWRQSVARKEDDTVHLLHGAAPSQQVSLSQKLDQIDRWGKLATIVAVAYGVILGGLYIYQGIVAPGGM